MIARLAAWWRCRRECGQSYDSDGNVVAVYRCDRCRSTGV